MKKFSRLLRGKDCGMGQQGFVGFFCLIAQSLPVGIRSQGGAKHLNVLKLCQNMAALVNGFFCLDEELLAWYTPVLFTWL
jgi:hypothetical protein